MGKQGNGAEKRVGALRVKGVNYYRDAKQVKLLRMREGGKPIRDSSGKIVRAAEFQGRLAPGTQVHVIPERAYWENTRTIKQNQLEAFREAIEKNRSDPNAYVVKSRSLPMSLLVENKSQQKGVGRANILDVENYGETFGPGSRRKKPKMSCEDIIELAEDAESRRIKYDGREIKVEEEFKDAEKDPMSLAGQSKRIWNELYKVIDSSDVLVEVTDARIPEETRCRKIEKYIREEKPHKHVVILMNKCDLVPNVVSVSINRGELGIHVYIIRWKGSV